MLTQQSTTTLRMFLREPFDLALGQPHQMLISSASVAIVAVEASTIVPWPFNVALAVGAEWAYLRGLISGAGVKTPWAARLNWAAFLLVVLYGSLAGLRGFRLIPDAPPPFVAVLLTFIHIGAISAVTLCSAMLHRAGEDAKAAARKIVQDREDAAAERERQYQEELQRQKDAQQLAIEGEWKRAQLALESERQQAALLIERDRARAELRRSVASVAYATTQPGVARASTRAPIVYAGVEYPTVLAAAKAHGISRQAMDKRLRKEKSNQPAAE